MKRQRGAIVKRSFSGMALLLVLFVSVGFANAVSDTEDTTDNHIQRMIGDYKSKLISNQLERFELKENLEWLNLKIKSLVFSNRPVSGEIYNSVHYKTSRIMALEKEKAYCLERLAQFQSQVQDPSGILVNNTKDMENDLIKTIRSRIEATGLSDWLEIEPDPDGRSYRIRTILPILFSSGSAVIFKEYDAFLKNLAGLIKAFNSQVIVDGFADIDPIHTRQYPSNLELGAARAANVVHTLVRHGVNPSAFKIASTGEYRFLPLKVSANKTLERYVNITVFISG